MKLGPMFKHFGSKWQSAKLYPAPRYPVIHEPFAGGAGYSLNHAERNVKLYDFDPHISNLWKFLISAKESEIREIPLDLPEGTDIRTLGLSDGQALLLGRWQGTFPTGTNKISAWGNKPGQWTANTRARVAEQSQALKHWEVLNAPLHTETECTHYIDIGNYAYKMPPINFAKLGEACLRAKGQVIVCEGLGKDGTPPTWLPFVPLAERVNMKRSHRLEYIWTN